VVVAAVPWARHGSRFSRTFEDEVARLVTRCDLTAVAELVRIAWRSVGAIIARVTQTRNVVVISWPACGGSGSTRSPTGAASAI
jgi:hypothetical protein